MVVSSICPFWQCDNSMWNVTTSDKHVTTIVLTISTATCAINNTIIVITLYITTSTVIPPSFLKGPMNT